MSARPFCLTAPLSQLLTTINSSPPRTFLIHAAVGGERHSVHRLRARACDPTLCHIVCDFGGMSLRWWPISAPPGRHRNQALAALQGDLRTCRKSLAGAIGG